MKRDILDRNPALSLDGLRQVPKDVLRYVCYVESGGHAAARYRRLADGARKFNDTMDRIFSRYMGIAEAGSVEVFHRDRDSDTDDLHMDKNDLEEIHAARMVSSAAKKIARILTMSICQKPHSAYINLTGFPEAEIFTIMTVCHSENKWRAVQWTSANRHGTQTATNRAPNVAICEEIKRRHRPKSILHIGVSPDGSWRAQKMPSTVSTAHGKPPEATLEEFLIPERAQERGVELNKPDRLGFAARLGGSLMCLLGSPFLQDAWNSETMRCSGGDIFVPGHFYGDVNHDAKDNKSFILELGALLWELFFQQKVNITEEDEDESDEASLFNALNREEEMWRKKCVDAACLDIISNCLEACCEGEVDEEKLRATIHRTVFRPLREYQASYIHPLSNDFARVPPPSFLHHPSTTLKGSTVSLSSIYLSNTTESESCGSFHPSTLGNTQLPVISESIEFIQEVSLLTLNNGTGNLPQNCFATAFTYNECR